MNRIETLVRSIDRSVQELVSGRELGLMFSGGIDSCVIAQMTRRYASMTAYTIGLPRAHDLAVAEATASRLGIDWQGILLDEGMIREAVIRMPKVIGTSDPLTISFEMPLYFIAQMAKEELLSCGQGADELFGGYARYEGMAPEERRRTMRDDVTGLLAHGLPMERTLASHFGKVIVHPFLDPNVIEIATELPDDLIVSEGVRKVALRQVAVAIGLDVESQRKKKAAQYGSGVMRAMKAMAKADGCRLGEWTSKMSGIEEAKR